VSATFFLVLALALNPAILNFVRFPMSEIIYLTLSLSSLALCDGSRSPPTRKMEIFAALLAVAAMHTRLAGVMLVVALLAAFAVRRRLFAFVFTTVLAVTSFGGWIAFLRYARTIDATAHASPLLAYDLSYTDFWAISGVKSLAELGVQACQGAYFATNLTLGSVLPEKLLDRAAEGGSAVPLATCVVGFLAVVAAGAWGRLSSRAQWPPFARAETVYLPLTLVLVLLWPSATWRLLVPLTPWLLVLSARGLAFLLRSPRVGALVASATLLAFAGAGFSYNRAPGPRTFMAEGMPVHIEPLENALEAIRKLPPGARIGTPMTPLVYLHTGRLGAETWVGAQPAGPGMKGRTLRTFFVRGGQADIAAAYQSVYAALREYPELGITYAFSRRFPAQDFFLVAVEGLSGARTIFKSREYHLIALPW
jgi:hypothetical protein